MTPEERKAKRAAYQKQYREAHKERFAEYARKNRQTESRKEYMKEYRRAHKAEAAAYQRERYHRLKTQKNPEKAPE